MEMSTHMPLHLVNLDVYMCLLRRLRILLGLYEGRGMAGYTSPGLAEAEAEAEAGSHQLQSQAEVLSITNDHQPLQHSSALIYPTYHIMQTTYYQSGGVAELV